MRVLGLTGPIAGGKSTVARWLARQGAAVIDCDQLARDVVAPQSALLAAVLARFGAHLQLPDGSLDRAALAGLVFGDAAALADLEALIHPAVTARLEGLLASCPAPVVVIEAVKLVEAGYHRRCHEVWLVTAPAPLRAARLEQTRGLAPAEAARRIAAQGDFAAARAVATRVIVNDGSPEALTAAVATAWQTRRAGAEGESDA
ncbi:MAG: dephospho-CoA kinase [Fimbriimonadaceae bacterium]|nr:dephospho-CoA kinase [Fimbriimonadaceae bacterium]